MKIRATREWVFEVPDDVDTQTLDDQMYWFFRGAWPRYEQVDSTASWCILTPEGVPLAPSQYPRGKS